MKYLNILRTLCPLSLEVDVLIYNDVGASTEMTMKNQTDILLREVGVRANAIIGRLELVAAP